MEQGADPHVVAPETCNFEPSFMHDENAELNTKPIRFSGKTAIECLLAAKRVLTQADPDAWGKGIDDIGRALTILSEARSPPGMAKIPVSEGVVDTWAAVLADAQSADVAIRALAGPEGRERGRAAEGGKVLHAHSVVLRAASPVLAAMLSKGMREGERKEIDLEDCGYREVQVLLSLMYTSSLPGDEEEPSAHTLLEALRLAHRWQARQVVEILEAGLAKALKKETLEPILEEALALGLPRLSQACKVFISNNDQLMRSKLAPRGQGFRSAAVRSEVARVLKCDVSGGGSDGGADKRRRLP
uniref:BTB domain-containing protein n=1 Tax=Zooxanthella nutricula TaxID=1333877 RepID=A0A7S2PC89_9DINO|mmetsp:Transcript_53095/g.161297  ORF Transcript_53095/g.161297 Transcript_53095/m.161297 type:complete len:302 (+) Transcript_53095:1-906(+)